MDFTGQVKEQRMGELFENFKDFDFPAAKKKIREESLAESLEKGKHGALEKINKLLQCLLAEGRMEDIKHMAEDRDYQKKLLKEFEL